MSSDRFSAGFLAAVVEAAVILAGAAGILVGGVGIPGGGADAILDWPTNSFGRFQTAQLDANTMLTACRTCPLPSPMSLRNYVGNTVLVTIPSDPVSPVNDVRSR